MRGNQVTVLLDGKEAAHVEAPEMKGREVGLWAGWNSQAWSQRNLADDVYDGVFERLIITSAKERKESLIYSSELSGFDKWRFDVNQKWESVLGWFLKHF